MTRTVLVTGGGTGIGRAVATAFAQDGDTVFITGRRTGPLEQTASELGSSVHAVTCDNSDPKDLKRLQDTLPANVDVVVHCAGGNTDFDRETPSDLSTLAAGWRANLESNLLSAVLTTAAVRDRLTPRRPRHHHRIHRRRQRCRRLRRGQSCCRNLEHRPGFRIGSTRNHREHCFSRLHRRHRILP